MRVVHKTEIVPFTAAQMYDLVNNIESYPEYLPWCQETKVFSRTEYEVKASIMLARGGISHSFSTLNRMQPNKLIEVELMEGPFRHLKGSWYFEDLEEGSSEIQFAHIKLNNDNVKDINEINDINDVTDNKQPNSKQPNIKHACRINFYLEFILANRILDMAVGPLLEKIANTFVDAFTERAQALYGNCEKLE